MKNLKKVLFAGAIAAIMSLANSASAQYKPTGNDGITASPKVRQALDERNAGFRAVPGTTGTSDNRWSNEAQTAGVANQLPEPAATVFSKYIRIQPSLAKDSVENLVSRAHAIAIAVRDDSSNTFPGTVAQQADELMGAADLPTARKAFKSLSQSLIEYRAKSLQVAGLLRQVHCPIANADWLQVGSVVNNPYLGMSSARCGEFVSVRASDDQTHLDPTTQ